MAIAFFNIRSKETLIADTEPMISALWSSSDHSPNITQGQDFGWRLAPEVVVEMDAIKADEQKIIEIAHRYNRLPEDVNEPDILTYISDKTAPQNAPVANDGDYQDEYDEEVRKLKRLNAKKKADAEEAAASVVTDTTTESIEQMRERVELAERLAAANIAAAAPAATDTTATTTASETTTTTTTVDRVRRPRS